MRPQRGNCPILLTYVDVMRQTRTSSDTASEHTLPNSRDEATGNVLSEERIGNDTSPILWEQAPGRLDMGKWSTYKEKKQDLTHSGPKNGPDLQRNKKLGDRMLGRRRDQVARSSREERVL